MKFQVYFVIISLFGSPQTFRAIMQNRQNWNSRYDLILFLKKKTIKEIHEKIFFYIE